MAPWSNRMVQRWFKVKDNGNHPSYPEWEIDGGMPSVWFAHILQTVIYICLDHLIDISHADSSVCGAR